MRTWFDHKRFGDSNARQMAATYSMIANKQLPDTVSPTPKRTASKKARASKQEPTPKGSAVRARHEQPSSAALPQPTAVGPNVHLDIQIHIPAEDANADQIDQIFASMAKHLYRQ